jgi:hypothetical protein
VLGRVAPAESCGPALQSSQDTASTPLLGSVPGTPGGIAASGPRPGLILGCGPSRPASRHPARVITNGIVSCVSSGQHHSAGFPRPSHTGVWPTVTLRHWWPVPFRPAVSVTCVQGVSANNTKYLDQTRGTNAATLSTHSTAPSVLHCTARQHLRSTAAQPLGLRPPASARWEAVCALPDVPGTLCCRCSSIVPTPSSSTAVRVKKRKK